MSDATSSEPTAVPASALLHAWTLYEWRDGLRTDDLAALDRLTVKTRNSTYEIVIVLPGTGEVMVRGGAFFPAFAPARLAGCSLGGSFLKVRSAHVGFCLEFVLDAQVILTSPVKTIAFAAGTNAPRRVM